MTETIACPSHGLQPAVAHAACPDYSQCRRCWYREWLRAVLGYPARSRR